MADALNNIIDLNVAIQEDDLEKAKTLVAELNTQIDELKDRFEISENQDICDFFSLQMVFEDFNNNTRNYVLNNFKGINSETIKAFTWFDKVNLLFKNSDKNKMMELLESTLSSTIEKFQISSIFRMINYTQRYDLFKILKEKEML